MMSFIITSLVIIGLSMMLGMFPSIILAILLEMKGLGPYVYALTILVASIIELVKFISYVFCNSNIKLNIKDIFKMIKSLFNRKNKETNKVINKPKNKSITLNTIEAIVINIFVIYAIFVPTHSLLASLIYKNVIIPSTMLKEFTTTFLDGMSVKEVEKELGVKLHICRNGEHLVQIIAKL